MSDAEIIPFTPPEEAEPEPLLRSIVGDVLRRTRQDQDRTLAEVSREAQVSMPYLSEVERGLKEPSSEVLAAVCRALGLRLVDLVSRTQEILSIRALEDFRRPSPVRPSSHRPGDVTLMLAA